MQRTIYYLYNKFFMNEAVSEILKYFKKNSRIVNYSKSRKPGNSDQRKKLKKCTFQCQNNYQF